MKLLFIPFKYLYFFVIFQFQFQILQNRGLITVMFSSLLNNNEIREIPEGAFQDLPNLTFL